VAIIPPGKYEMYKGAALFELEPSTKIMSIIFNILNETIN